MPKFRKKPVVVEAVQWKGFGQEGERDIAGLCWEHAHDGNALPTPHIHTLEGTMAVSPGDWIIQGVNGEHYPCKPDIFEKTYEAVEEG